ncbi:hypothetical protein AB0P37_08380 [Streptomyces antimycoticus]|uniref:hypothetical protein n=1 Tax=Streptomyces antimycoticus TaxID=68175 RepID=UPI00343FBA67
MTTTLKFETEDCTRCDGTGKHSFNPMHGHVCFKCKGSKRSLTRRGKAARAAFEAEITKWCSQPMWALSVGDVIWHRMANGRQGWVTITSREDNPENPRDFGVIRTDGEDFAGSWDARFVRHEPENRQGIREDIVQRFKGASLSSQEG